VPILAIYATGLLLSIIALVEGTDTPRARLCFYLSVLGLRLFTYYQGRSALGNLLSASYPAVLLVVLIAADLRRDLLAQARAADRLLAVTLLALLSYSVPALATIAPDWVRPIAGKIRVTRSKRETQVLGDVAFLRRFVRPGQEIVIMSYNSGLYHLMTRTTNPLDIPGDSELVYRRDIEKQLNYTIQRRGMFVVDKTTMTADAVENIRRFNPVFFDNPSGKLIVFPRPGASSPADGR
jgi:hypothetical protein